MMSLSGSCEGTTCQRSRGSERNVVAGVCDFGVVNGRKRRKQTVSLCFDTRIE